MPKQQIILIVMSIIATNKNKVNPMTAIYTSTIIIGLYGYRKCGTHTSV